MNLWQRYRQHGNFFYKKRQKKFCTEKLIRNFFGAILKFTLQHIMTLNYLVHTFLVNKLRSKPLKINRLAFFLYLNFKHLFCLIPLAQDSEDSKNPFIGRHIDLDQKVWLVNFHQNNPEISVPKLMKVFSNKYRRHLRNGSNIFNNHRINFW